MRAATGSQWRSMSSGVTCALFGWLNTRRAAAFWIICSGVLRRERQKQLSIIGIAMIGKTLRADDRAQRGGVNGKEKWSHHRALGHPSGEEVRYRQLTLPRHVERAPS